MTNQTDKPGYKKTEIGIIPEDWALDKISNLAKITTGSKNTQDKEETGRYPFFVRSQKVERINTYSFNGEAVLTAGDGVGTGKIFHYINGKFDYHQRVYKISDFREDIHGYFFFLYFSNYFLKRIQLLTAKSSVDSVRGETINDMEIPLPPIQEQSAIAQVLSDTDQLIESLNKLIQKKKKIKQGAMQELLTGRKRLPGFSGRWEEKALRELLDYEQPGKYIVKDSSYTGSNTPVLTANKTFILGYTDETDGVYIDTPVIIFDDFTTEKKYVDFPFKVKSSAMKILKPKNNNVHLKYMADRLHLLEFQTTDFKQRCYISQYQNLIVTIPPIQEQTAIAQVLSDMDSEIEELERKRDKYQEIKKGMMQKLLTGEIRLPIKT